MSDTYLEMPGGCRQENINEKNSPLNNIQHVPLMEPDTNTKLTSQPKIDNIISSLVIEILSFRKKTLLLYTIG